MKAKAQQEARHRPTPVLFKKKFLSFDQRHHLKGSSNSENEFQLSEAKGGTPAGRDFSWQDVLWREWRNTDDEEYARHLFELVGDEPVGKEAFVVSTVLGAIYGGPAALLAIMLAVMIGWPAPAWLPVVGLGAVLGSVFGFLTRKIEKQVSWRVWLSRLTFNLAPNELGLIGGGLMLGLGGGLIMMWSKMSALDTQIKAQTSEEPEKQAVLEEPLGIVVPLETFIVNLADKGGTRYLRLTIGLELGSKELQKEINKRLPQVRDSILMILPTKRFSDISTAEGKIALRDEMMEKLNSFLTQGSITNIYFREFVVQ